MHGKNCSTLSEPRDLRSRLLHKFSGLIVQRYWAKQRAPERRFSTSETHRLYGGANHPWINAAWFASHLAPASFASHFFLQKSSFLPPIFRACEPSHTGERCVRIAEVEGSIPFESTKNGNRRGFYHGDFSFDHRNTTDGF